MFCSNCGVKLNGGNFCPNCGEKIQILDTKLSATPLTSENDINKIALRIYLKELLELEFACVAVDKKGRKQSAIISQLEKNNYKETFHLCDYCVSDTYGVEPYYAHLKYDGKNIKILGFKTEFGTYQIYTGNEEYLLSSNNGEYRTFNVSDAANFPWDFHHHSPGVFRENKCRKLLAKALNEKCNYFKNVAPKKYTENGHEIYWKKQDLKELASKLKKAKQLLSNAYAINIIPNQYRNIYAIYYLENYIGSSNENLSNALLHFDLNEIKQKLDKIIENQEKIILEMAYVESQNQAIISQNQEQLNHMAQIETNSELASRYSRLSASYSEATAWFALANLIQKSA